MGHNGVGIDCTSMHLSAVTGIPMSGWNFLRCAKDAVKYFLWFRAGERERGRERETHGQLE